MADPGRLAAVFTGEAGLTVPCAAGEHAPEPVPYGTEPPCPGWGVDPDGDRFLCTCGCHRAADKGMVTWPHPADPDWLNTHEGAMSVWAFFPAVVQPARGWLPVTETTNRIPDAWSGDVLIPADAAGRVFPNLARIRAARARGGHHAVTALFDVMARESEQGLTPSAPVPLLAVMCLGTTARTLRMRLVPPGLPVLEHAEYWHAGPDDLTAEGGQLVYDLQEMYGVPPTLLTHLDTSWTPGKGRV